MDGGEVRPAKNPQVKVADKAKEIQASEQRMHYLFNPNPTYYLQQRCLRQAIPPPPLLRPQRGQTHLAHCGLA